VLPHHLNCWSNFFHLTTMAGHHLGFDNFLSHNLFCNGFISFCSQLNLPQNNLAVKKVRPCLNGYCEKAVKSKGAAKKWLWWYRSMAKILITTIQVNLCCLIPTSLGISTRFTWIVVIKFLPSAYTITAIFLVPPLISQLFSH